jgi:hypothetical protein
MGRAILMIIVLVIIGFFLAAMTGGAYFIAWLGLKAGRGHKPARIILVAMGTYELLKAGQQRSYNPLLPLGFSVAMFFFGYLVPKKPKPIHSGMVTHGSPSYSYLPVAAGDQRLKLPLPANQQAPHTVMPLPATAVAESNSNLL